MRHCHRPQLACGLKPSGKCRCRLPPAGALRSWRCCCLLVLNSRNHPGAGFELQHCDRQLVACGQHWMRRTLRCALAAAQPHPPGPPKLTDGHCSPMHACCVLPLLVSVSLQPASWAMMPAHPRCSSTGGCLQMPRCGCMERGAVPYVCGRGCEMCAFVWGPSAMEIALPPLHPQLSPAGAVLPACPALALSFPASWLAAPPAHACAGAHAAAAAGAVSGAAVGPRCRLSGAGQSLPCRHTRTGAVLSRGWQAAAEELPGCAPSKCRSPLSRTARHLRRLWPIATGNLAGALPVVQECTLLASCNAACEPRSQGAAGALSGAPSRPPHIACGPQGTGTAPAQAGPVPSGLFRFGALPLERCHGRAACGRVKCAVRDPATSEQPCTIARSSM